MGPGTPLRPSSYPYSPKLNSRMAGQFCSWRKGREGGREGDAQKRIVMLVAMAVMAVAMLAAAAPVFAQGTGVLTNNRVRRRSRVPPLAPHRRVNQGNSNGAPPGANTTRATIERGSVYV